MPVAPASIASDARFRAVRRARLRVTTAVAATLVIIVALGDAGARVVLDREPAVIVPLDLWIAFFAASVLLGRRVWRRTPQAAALPLGVLVVNNTLLAMTLAPSGRLSMMAYTVMAIVAAAVLFPWSRRLHTVFLLLVSGVAAIHAIAPFGTPLDSEALMGVAGAVVVSGVAHGVLLRTALREHAHARRLRESRRELTEQGVRLSASESELAEAQAVARVGSWDLDLVDGTLRWSNEMRRILGVDPDVRPTRELYLSLVHPADRDDAEAAIAGALVRGHFAQDVRVVRPNGEERWLHARGRTTFERNGRPIRMTGIGHDVTERKTAELELARLALHDGLTGLANWTLFRDRLGHALQMRAPATVAVAIVDLDDFKLVNDTLGHAAGDLLLQVVATRLATVLRSGDTVARLGGDEFAILLEGSDVETARLTAARVLEALSLPVHVGDREHQVSASVGVAAGQPWIDRDEVLRAADIAMYEAKARGKGRLVVFRPEMQHDVTEREVLKQALRSALAQDELRLVYQPLFDLRSSTVVAAEALVRWRDPERGDVPPASFIPIAEATGLILDVDRWVLRRALAQLREWNDERVGVLRLAVNVSILTLEDPVFPAQVRQALDEFGLEGSRLELEVTESALARDVRRAMEAIHELQSLGVAIAIDDFGTGYSTLARLKALPFDALKIDQSFVQEIDGPDASSPLLRAMVGIGRALGVRVTGEGIETQAQLDFLRDQGCQEGQGFLLSPPVEPEAIVALLQESSQDFEAARRPRSPHPGRGPRPRRAA